MLRERFHIQRLVLLRVTSGSSSRCSSDQQNDAGWCSSDPVCAEREPVDYRVTGLDLSPRSLQFAREAAASEGLLVEWVQADMRDIPADTLFDAIVNVFTAEGGR